MKSKNEKSRQNNAKMYPTLQMENSYSKVDDWNYRYSHLPVTYRRRKTCNVQNSICREFLFIERCVHISNLLTINRPFLSSFFMVSFENPFVSNSELIALFCKKKQNNNKKQANKQTTIPTAWLTVNAIKWHLFEKPLYTLQTVGYMAILGANGVM